MRILSLLLALAFTACAAPEDSKVIPPAKAASMIEKEVQLLDVRTEEEWNAGHIEGATRVEIGSEDFAEQVKKHFDPEKPLLVYCRSGGRSARAAKQLEELGFETVYDLKGGVLAWEKADRELVK